MVYIVAVRNHSPKGKGSCPMGFDIEQLFLFYPSLFLFLVQYIFSDHIRFTFFLFQKCSNAIAYFNCNLSV
jgi:hypothetical protein